MQAKYVWTKRNNIKRNSNYINDGRGGSEKDAEMSPSQRKTKEEMMGKMGEEGQPAHPKDRGKPLPRPFVVPCSCCTGKRAKCWRQRKKEEKNREKVPRHRGERKRGRDVRVNVAIYPTIITAMLRIRQPTLMPQARDRNTNTNPPSGINARMQCHLSRRDENQGR